MKNKREKEKDEDIQNENILTMSAKSPKAK